MPQFIRDAIDCVAGPTTFFVGATLGFIAMIRWRRFVANGLVGWAIVNLFLLFFGLSMTDYDFRDIVTKPDNVPIVGLLILVGCFFWFALAPRGDQRRPDRPGPADPRRARAREDPDLARPGLHRADLHGDPDDRPGRLGDRAPGPAGTAGQLDRRPQPVEGPLVLPRVSRRCWSTSIPGWPASCCPA